MTRNHRILYAAVLIAALLMGCAPQEDAAPTDSARRRRLPSAQRRIPAGRKRLSRSRGDPGERTAVSRRSDRTRVGSAGNGGYPVGAGDAEAGDPTAPVCWDPEMGGFGTVRHGIDRQQETCSLTDSRRNCRGGQRRASVRIDLDLTAPTCSPGKWCCG